MGEKFNLGVCDLIIGVDDPRAPWDSDACERFNPKHKQVIDKDMPQYCLKVCGNCEYFTVAQYEYVFGNRRAGGEVERIGQYSTKKKGGN